MLITCENITKAYTDKVLIDHQNFNVRENDKIGIIGVNGCGKSTLLKIIGKLEEPDTGDVTYQKHKKVTYLSQELLLNEELTALEQVKMNVKDKDEYVAKSMLQKLGISDVNKIIKEMSGGEKRKVSIASTLVMETDCLLIDEITNHLDNDTIVFLEKYLIKFNKAIVMVTHDRYFLERITNNIVEIYRGKLYYYEGSYSRYLELKAERLENMISYEKKRQVFLRKEYEWIKRGAIGRLTKSKKRIENYYNVLNEEGLVEDKKISLTSISQRLGRKTIEVNNVSKSYDKVIIKDFSMNLENDARIGIIGKNGSGKTTLLKLITKQSEPDSGSVVIGETVKIGYFSQENEKLPLEKRVYDFLKEKGEVIETVDGTLSITQILEKFLFFKESQYAYISKLSGGERRRLYLLSILVTSPNVLILDEPTNDLDIETLEALEEYLNIFKGAVITVSHDRYFLDKVVDMIYLVDEGCVTKYQGNYSDYEESDKKNKKIEKKEQGKNISNEQPKQKVKMTFKEKREYETILDEISHLEDRIKELDNIINNSYQNYSLVKEEMKEKEMVEQELEEKMNRWEYLSLLDEKSNK
ncbi:MAG: ABC-F family ATP-binding cassette domain-containing protein [Bacilli bacterium]|nr:ABC-F family ATP-binding cassette domain-containing protein [Acholeplasmataceae bacterium]MDY2901917.1 ABC-F family ATP-binding cassette domain-containing protein [Bacilli bacterium]